MKKYMFLPLMLMFHGCGHLWSGDDYYEGCFCIKNLSEETLTAYIAFGLQETASPTQYPDTCLPETSTTFYPQRYGFEWVEYNLYNRYMTSPRTINPIERIDVLDRHQLDTLSVFMIHRDTLLKYGYDDVRENYRILVRYDLDWEEVKKLNYIFPYPPTPDMKNMKMYPSYQEVINQETARK